MGNIQEIRCQGCGKIRRWDGYKCLDTCACHGFDDWFWELEKLADEIEFPLGDQDSYMEYYTEGNTPEETLRTEVSYAVQ